MNGNIRNIRAGFVGFGEVNTPREIIERKCTEAAEQLEGLGIELVSTAPVSDVPDGSEAERAITDLGDGEFDLLVVCIAGWIPSHAVIKVTQEFSHLPMLLWGLTGYYQDGRLVTTADQAGTTALRSTFEGLDYTFKYVYSTVDGGAPLEKIGSFARACLAGDLIKHAKVGMMGYRDMNLYGTMFDGMTLKRALGVEIEFFEMLEIQQIIDRLDQKPVDDVVSMVTEKWEFEKEAERQTLETGSRIYLAVKEKVLERGYEGVSLIDVDGVKKLMNFPPSMAFMLLADDPGVCTIPENDSLGSVTQLITKYLTSQCAAYMEFYEFMKDRVLMGVPDFVPSEIVADGVKVVPTAFGGFGEGILNISRVKTGRVTLARLTDTKNGYGLHLVTGEAVEPRSWEEAGWEPPSPQLPGLEIILDTPVEEFAEKVYSQHYILSYGDNSALFVDFCRLKGIDIL